MEVKPWNSCLVPALHNHVSVKTPQKTYLTVTAAPNTGVHNSV